MIRWVILVLDSLGGYVDSVTSRCIDLVIVVMTVGLAWVLLVVTRVRCNCRRILVGRFITIVLVIRQFDSLVILWKHRLIMLVLTGLARSLYVSRRVVESRLVRLALIVLTSRMSVLEATWCPRWWNLVFMNLASVCFPPSGR